MLESAVIANEFAAVSVKVVRQGRGLRLRLAAMAAARRYGAERWWPSGGPVTTPG